MNEYYVRCEVCNGQGYLIEYDMVRDEIFNVECKSCNGTGEIFVVDDESEE